MGIIREPKEVYLTIESRTLKKDEVKTINDFIKAEKCRKRNSLPQKNSRKKRRAN